MKTLILSLLLASAALAQIPGTDQNAKTANLTASSADCTTPGACLTVDLRTAGATVAGVQVTGTFSGTVTFESSVDCATWSSLSIYQVSVGNSAEQTGVTTTGQWSANVSGFCAIRARMSVYSSGTAGVLLRPSVGVSTPFSSLAVAAIDGLANTSGATSRVPGAAGYPLVWPMIFNGATWDRSFYCNQTAAVSVTAASTTQIVALSGTTKIRVCSFSVTMSAAGTAQWMQGTGSNCGTGTANLTAATSLATATPWTVSAGPGAVFTGTAGAALCLAAATGNVTGFVTYAQY